MYNFSNITSGASDENSNDTRKDVLLVLSCLFREMYNFTNITTGASDENSNDSIKTVFLVLFWFIIKNEFVTRDEHKLDRLQTGSSHVTNQKKTSSSKKTNSN